MNHLGRPRRPHQAALIIIMTSREYEGQEHEPDFLATLDGQRSKLGHSLLPLVATPFRDRIFFRKDKNPSAIAAVPPDGGSNWMAAEEELEPLFGGSASRPKDWMAAAYGGAVACG